MSISKDKMLQLLQEINSNQTLAESLLEKGLDCFVSGQSPLQNQVLQELLLDDIQLVGETEINALMAEAKKKRQIK